MKNLKMKKGPKKFDFQEWGFEPQIFSNFPAHDLNFRGRCGGRDQILVRKLKFLDFKVHIQKKIEKKCYS